MSSFQRITHSFTNVANGIHFGVPYLRARGFEMPRQMNVRGQGRVSLNFPAEHGVLADFMACVIRNDYGLSHGLGRVRTILDIGANIGLFSLTASDFYPDARIQAYEPNPRVLPFLESNTSGIADCNVFPEAVGHEPGTVRIVEQGCSNLASTVKDEGGNIPQVAFREVVDRVGGSVDLLKMDCEGAEWEIFRAKECWAKVGRLRMEYHLVSGHQLSDVVSALSALNFTIKRLVPDQSWGIVWADRISAGAA